MSLSAQIQLVPICWEVFLESTYTEYVHTKWNTRPPLNLIFQAWISGKVITVNYR